MAIDWHSHPIDRLADLLAQLVGKSDTPTRDFFYVRLVKDLEDLVQRAEDAVLGGELVLREGHSFSHLVLDEVFRGNETALFRGIHFAADSRFMSSVIMESWNARITELISQGRLLEARRLIVYSEEEELRTRATREMLTTVGGTPGYSHKTLSEDRFRQILRDRELDVPHDFGIYSDKYVFLSNSRDPSNLAGTWLANVAQVARFIDAFDACWAISGGIS
jgi:hypothetical protein